MAVRRGAGDGASGKRDTARTVAGDRKLRAAVLDALPLSTLTAAVQKRLLARDGSHVTWLLSQRPERLAVEILCDPMTPAAVREYIVRRIIDRAQASGLRTTTRDRDARLEKTLRAAADADLVLPRAWKDPDGKLWRGRPRMWPPTTLRIWLRGRLKAEMTAKRYQPRQPAQPADGRRPRRPLGPPRRSTPPVGSGDRRGRQTSTKVDTRSR